MRQKIYLALLILAIIALGYYYLIRPQALVGAPNQPIKEESLGDKESKTSPAQTVEMIDYSTTTDEKATNNTVGGTDLPLLFGESSYVYGVQITPYELIEDSRCPTDVNCIQAGTVRVRARLTDGENQLERTFILGQGQELFGKEIVLQSVAPPKISTKQIRISDYQLNFLIK